MNQTRIRRECLVWIVLAGGLVTAAGCRSNSPSNGGGLSLPPTSDNTTAPEDHTIQPPIPSRPFPKDAYKRVGTAIRKKLPGASGAIRIVVGDLNGDGRVTLDDVKLAMSIAVTKRQPSARELAAGDLNGDGRITLKDVTAINRAITEKVFR